MEEKKLTDEEIAQAFEQCLNRTHPIGCLGCPYFEKDIDCEVESDKYALDLINRQKAEIERLMEENVALSKGVKRLKKRYEEAIKQNADECVKKFCETTMYAEQERLLKENAELQKQVDELKAENTELYKEHTTLIAGSILQKQKVQKDLAKEILQEGKHCLSKSLQDWIKERCGVEAE